MCCRRLSIAYQNEYRSHVEVYQQVCKMTRPAGGLPIISQEQATQSVLDTLDELCQEALISL